MEIRRRLCYILIKCLVIQYVSAKTISLNELIAAESQKNQLTEEPPQPKLAGLKAKLISLNEINTEESHESQEPDISSSKFPGPSKHSSLLKRLAKIKELKPGTKLLDNVIFRDTKISPLRYRKTFEIKSPLKPKKLKLGFKSKRKNQSVKREINGNESLKQKYIPLLKSLSMLFDNLLNSDESESFEVKTKKYKRHRFYSEEQFEVPCNCSSKPSFGNAESSSQKETTSTASSLSTEISSDTEDFPVGTNYDDSTYRPHKIIPILLPRNTFSRRRNDYGSSKRSRSTPNRDIEGNISRDYGDHEHNSGWGENDSSAKSDENYTDSVTRNDTSGVGHRRRDGKRNNTTNSKNRKRVTETTKNEDSKDSIGKNKFKIGRNKIESEELLREPTRGLRGFVSNNKTSKDDGIISERFQPKEIREESVLSTTHASASHQRVANKSSPHTTEDEKIRPRNETVIIIEENIRSNNSKSIGKKAPVLLIFDGYSVTRDKNGENKVSGKTIHIRS